VARIEALERELQETKRAQAAPRRPAARRKKTTATGGA